MSSLSELKDEDVAERVQKGDSESFSILIDRYEPKLGRYAKKFLFDREDAQDLVQDVFLKAYVNLQSFDTSKKFSPWIYRIAHNEFVNALKKRTRNPILNFFDPETLLPQPADPDTPDTHALEKELKEELERSLGSMDPKYREPLVLYFFEEMSYEEISDVLQLPQTTVGVRLKRGKAILKKMLHTHER